MYTVVAVVAHSTPVLLGLSSEHLQDVEQVGSAYSSHVSSLLLDSPAKSYRLFATGKSDLQC